MGPDSSSVEASSGGGDGAASEAKAGDSCVPVGCPQQGYACGPATDGCGRTIDCGTCAGANSICDLNHHCACKPATCTSLGAECGSVPDGCGNTLDCGKCEAGTCGGAGALKCGSGTCLPQTCASLGAACGQIDDGCGNIVQCADTCLPPQTCDGAGNANQCGCTAKTCASLGWSCGAGDDGCGNTVLCGGCDGGACDPNSHSCTCAPQKTCASQQWGCGSFTDSCNAQEVCGPAPTQNTDVICSDPSRQHYYACCVVVAGLDAGSPTFDGGLCNPRGPTPPEPNWDCVAKSTPNGGVGWCCAQ
jgi:hypothetical protein